MPASSSEEGLAADGKYACCTFRGSLSALDAATGAVIWKTYTIPEEPKPTRKNRLGVQLTGPSGAAVWSSPTVDLDKGMVFVTTGDSYSDPAAATSDAFVAFDLKSGKLLWSRQITAGDAFTVDCDFPEAVRANCPTPAGPDHDFGTSPIRGDAPLRRALIAGRNRCRVGDRRSAGARSCGSARSARADVWVAFNGASPPTAARMLPSRTWRSRRRGGEGGRPSLGYR